MEMTAVVETGLCVNMPQANRTQGKQTPWALVIILNSEILQVPSRNELCACSLALPGSNTDLTLHDPLRLHLLLAFAGVRLVILLFYFLVSASKEGVVSMPDVCLVRPFTVYLETKPPF